MNDPKCDRSNGYLVAKMKLVFSTHTVKVDQQQSWGRVEMVLDIESRCRM